jgi:acetyl coenzyme A synthetase (ADP forming)-like protein
MGGLKALSDSTLTPFFAPQGIAVIGASRHPDKLGYGLARNLIQSNFQGVIHLVNPRGGSLMGRPMYTSIAEAPDPVDLAVLLIPAEAVPEILVACGERGLRAVIVASGGFRETGAQGAALEAECLEIARRYRMRLLGPNCIGLLDTHLPLDATFLPPPGPLPGDVAFISHSGAICAAVIDWARGQGFGLSRLVSLGNQCDVNETDVIAPVAADPFTRVLTLYLEGVSDGRRFVKEASQVALKKPIIALKVGRFSSGQRAVASHTGALAGQENAFNAAFRRAGVIRADTSEEMFDWARALAWCPPPQGRAMAVLTNAGGPGVTAADALEASGLYLVDLQPETQAALQALLPAAASLNNPVDMLASATPEQYAACLQVLLQASEVCGVLVILPPPPMHTAGAVAKKLIPVIHEAGKPVIIALMGERLIQEAVEHFRAAHVPEYRFPERAASALAILAQRAEFLQRAGQHLAPESGASRQAAAAVLKGLPSGLLPVEAILQILEAYNIPTPLTLLSTSVEEAMNHAQRLGFPVAMKIASPDIAHKSDVGGVQLNIGSREAAAEAFEGLMRQARKAQPDAKLLGVHLQPMLVGGQEVILGAVQDDQFGPLIMFGSGGIEVEGLKDVAFGLAPLTVEEAEHMLASTWAGRKLRGYRSLLPADRSAVVQALLRLSRLAADFPELMEIEINPLRVLPEGQGAVALDVRARLGFAAEKSD